MSEGDVVRRTGVVLILALAMALVLGVAPMGAAQAVDVKPEWGSVSAQDGVLKRGCRSYAYQYAITPPSDGYWDLSVRVVGPAGRTLFFSYQHGESPHSATATYRLCRSETRPGRYKLKALVTVQDNDEQVQGRLPTVRFTLRKPG
ncbi:hypothetical protein [Nocardioides dilutus]